MPNEIVQTNNPAETASRVTMRQMTQMSGGGGVSTDATARAVVGMSLGAIKSWQERREMIWRDALDEYDQQYQVPISVEANYAGAWLEFDVMFDLWFVDEPERGSPYGNVPLFTYGLQYVSGEPMHVTVMVKQWHKKVQGCHGAKMIVGCFNPATGKLTEFKGLLHLNFEGYASPIIAEEETEE